MDRKILVVILALVLVSGCSMKKAARAMNQIGGSLPSSVDLYRGRSMTTVYDMYGSPHTVIHRAPYSYHLYRYTSNVCIVTELGGNVYNIECY